MLLEETFIKGKHPLFCWHTNTAFKEDAKTVFLMKKF
jgi:hypothetical protein